MIYLKRSDHMSRHKGGSRTSMESRESWSISAHRKIAATTSGEGPSSAALLRFLGCFSAMDTPSQSSCGRFLRFTTRVLFTPHGQHILLSRECKGLHLLRFLRGVLVSFSAPIEIAFLKCAQYRGRRCLLSC